MAREALILALCLTLLVLAARAGASRSRRHGVPGPGAQVLLGLGCGVAAAIVAAAPRVDLVPDRAELGVALGTVAALALLIGLMAWQRAVAHRPPRRRERRAGERTRLRG